MSVGTDVDADTDVDAVAHWGTALPHQDAASGDALAAEGLDAEALGVAARTAEDVDEDRAAAHREETGGAAAAAASARSCGAARRR